MAYSTFMNKIIEKCLMINQTSFPIQEFESVLSHQMGVFQWVWFKKSEHHSIMWEDFNRHRKKSNKILFEWWYFLSIFICIFYIGLSLFCEKILKFKVNYFLYIIVTFVIVFLLSFFTSKILKVLYNLLTGINRQFYKKIELK